MFKVLEYGLKDSERTYVVDELEVRRPLRQQRYSFSTSERWDYVDPMVRVLFLTQKQQRWPICPETGVVWKRGPLKCQSKCQTTAFETIPD
jgi:hypothetical protein